MARERATVLVVDDDGDIRLSLEMMLQYEGFEVWTAKDGEEALARLEREAQSGRGADLVLCDVKMPRLDGPGLLDRLQERGSQPSVIMISGHGDIATAVDALRRGAVDFLEKPLEQNRVVVSLRNALRGAKLAPDAALDAAFVTTGIDPGLRAEVLSVGQLCALCRALG